MIERWQIAVKQRGSQGSGGSQSINRCLGRINKSHPVEANEKFLAAESIKNHHNTLQSYKAKEKT